MAVIMHSKYIDLRVEFLTPRIVPPSPLTTLITSLDLITTFLM